MMENAARSLSEKILEVWDAEDADFSGVIFLCGKGNNGADGLASARMLYGKIPVQVYCPVLPQTDEGKVQSQMCKNLKVTFLSETQILKALSDKSEKIICDCIFGTGFHGTVPKEWDSIIKKANSAKAYRIACDISSGLSFNSDLTVTMGTYKTALFTDKAKSVSGEIVLSDLGITTDFFNKASGKTDCFIIEEKDIFLPLRKETSGHKGTYGHSVIMAGEKSGAAVLSAEAAMNFGSGLTTVLETDFSNLKQFKVSPELMISKSIPKTCKALQCGSGLGDTSKEAVQKAIEAFRKWFTKAKKPSCVIDADLFSYSGLEKLLKELNKVPEARIVLTPHPKELSLLAAAVLSPSTLESAGAPESLLAASATAGAAIAPQGSLPAALDAATASENRIVIGKAFTKKFPNITLVMKGANTFIANKGETYIFTGGGQCLAKGGSGDVLAGMITALLAQGCSAKDAAITAVYRHGTAACEYENESYSLTPKKLINLI